MSEKKLRYLPSLEVPTVCDVSSMVPVATVSVVAAEDKPSVDADVSFEAVVPTVTEV